jgi:hypothetical protein
MDDLGTHRTAKERNKLIPISVVLLAGVIVAGGLWTYSTRDWNASGTQKVGSPYSSAPSEGGKPLVLNK